MRNGGGKRERWESGGGRERGGREGGRQTGRQKQTDTEREQKQILSTALQLLFLHVRPRQTMSHANLIQFGVRDINRLRLTKPMTGRRARAFAETTCSLNI